MARWDPGTQQRLVAAALELYAEHGYDNVTVTQIAEHAGITRRSYFRYFPDKREVLFANSDQLPVAARAAVLAAENTSLSATLDALTAVGDQLAEYAAPHAAQRRLVIDASPDLQERERTKGATITTAIGDALQRRGVPPSRATLVAQLATVVFQNAFRHWIEADTPPDFAPYLHTAAASLRTTVTEDDR